MPKQVPVNDALVAQIAPQPPLKPMRERESHRERWSRGVKQRLGKREREVGQETTGWREEALPEVSPIKMASAQWFHRKGERIGRERFSL